jgi:hypothetical protein
MILPPLREIHALVDSEGLPSRVVVHSAAIQDRDAARLVLDKVRRYFPWLELIRADGGYNAWQVDAAVAKRLWRQMSSTTDPARLCRSSRNREQDKEGCAVWWYAFGP